MSEFIHGERGQGAIEYILLAGGIIVAAVVVFTIYSRMAGEAGNRINATTEAASSIMSSRINASLAEMFS
ncbi:class III signal peptide [archaeon BMS3Abin16]|nr:class III signal peptide [archaeon BMS3Abin16]GBE55859.1 class III signal peptide [archaeon BMS3Bbin16]HDY73769.1 class III signal peptide-containing protein [Euryarchaeota archaeon]